MNRWFVLFGVLAALSWSGRAWAYDPTAYTQGALSFPCIAGDPVVVSGAGGTALAAGAKVTGEAVRDIAVENGLVKVTYELMAQFGADPPTRELAAHMLYRWDDGAAEYRKAFLSYDNGAGDGLYGDWTYWANPFTAGAAEAHVLRATDDVAEVAFVFQHRLDYPGFYDSMGYTPPWCTTPPCLCHIPGCGPVEVDTAGNAISQAPHCGPACFRRVREVTWSKVIRVERCASGYFVGYHSLPDANDGAYGEQEIGTGWGSAVSWSSAGVVVRNPGQSSHQYLGIDDPPPPYANNAEQATGPWWVADLPYNNRDYEFPFIRYIVLEHPMEVGVWAFGLAQTGALVVHYTTEKTEPTTMAGRYQVFVGAVPYVSPGEQPCTIPGLPATNGPEPWRCYPAEPTTEAQALVTNNLPITWPN